MTVLNDIEVPRPADIARLRALVHSLAEDRVPDSTHVPSLIERGWVREVRSGHDEWLELTEVGRDTLAHAAEPGEPAQLAEADWAMRFAARRALRQDLSTPQELREEGRRLYPILGQDMTPESAADAVSSQWGDL